jgi:hypothetical protein
MKDFAKFFAFNLIVWGSVVGLVSVAEAEETCSGPEGVEIWGCYEGQAYWSIVPYGGDLPQVSGGTLFVPSKKVEKQTTATGRIVDRAIEQTAQTVENSISNGIDRHIYDLGKDIREIIY